jgi:hypothetical protein
MKRKTMSVKALQLRALTSFNEDRPAKLKLKPESAVDPEFEEICRASPRRRHGIDLALTRCSCVALTAVFTGWEGVAHGTEEPPSPPPLATGTH